MSKLKHLNVMISEQITLLGIAGSLRAASFNRALLRAASTLVPGPVRVDQVGIGSIPLYNQDLDDDRIRPGAVDILKSQIADRDGVLLATPEYNYGVPGVLKNVLDWVSRPAFSSPMAGKPVGIIGASPGASGAMRAQEQLKLNLLGMGASVFPHPGVAVTRAGQRFDDSLRLTDSETEKFLRTYMEAFSEWVVESLRQAHV